MSWYTRNATTGNLAYGGVLRDGVDGVDGLYAPYGVTISPDGQQVYAASLNDGSVAWYPRDVATGALAFGGVLKDGVAGVEELGGSRGVTISPDGKLAYVVSQNDDSLSWFTRDLITGALVHGGATSDTLKLTEAEIGAAITATANYLDGGGAAESVTSAATEAVATANRPPVFAAASDTFSIPENTESTFFVTATDPDGEVLSYSPSGPDAGLFTLNVVTGELALDESPDYENPTDYDLDGVYEVSVTVTDGEAHVTQRVAVVVTDWIDDGEGRVIHVDANATGIGDGASWETAYKHLQDALSAAAAGDEIWVAEGVYQPDRGGGRMAGDWSASFSLKNGVGLYGGFAGHEVSREERGPAGRSTVLSGAIDSNVSNRSLHVVTARDLNASAVLEGFVIRNGRAIRFDEAGKGGGLYAVFASPTITNCVFERNIAILAKPFISFNRRPISRIASSLTTTPPTAWVERSVRMRPRPSSPIPFLPTTRPRAAARFTRSSISSPPMNTVCPSKNCFRREGHWRRDIRCWRHWMAWPARTIWDHSRRIS